MYPSYILLNSVREPFLSHLKTHSENSCKLELERIPCTEQGPTPDLTKVYPFNHQLCLFPCCVETGLHLIAEQKRL